MTPQFHFKFSFLRFGTLLFIWWILTEGNETSLWLGFLLSILGGFLSRSSIFPKLKPDWIRLFSFLPCFLLSSFKSGWNVIQILLKPSMPLNPGVVRYKLSLPEGPSRIFLANLLTLLPGTLSVNLESDEVVLHVLNLDSKFNQEVQHWESKIAQLFSLELISVS